MGYTLTRKKRAQRHVKVENIFGIITPKLFDFNSGAHCFLYQIFIIYIMLITEIGVYLQVIVMRFSVL